MLRKTDSEIQKIANSKGQILYGMHFYPGVAEYKEPQGEPYRVYLNEDTIRSMDPTFAGRPVFVYHVDGVDADIDVVRQEADGWVIESFFNQSDGKHWVKFLVCSEKGEKAVANGMRLSNCYVPKSSAQGGLWNGVPYQKQITSGEYEHLAIVPNPRYDESIILTPDQFKKYNEDRQLELKRLSNNNGDKGMLTFFKRAKVENSIDIEAMHVRLPKSGKEISIAQLVNEADESEEKKGKPEMANADHIVELPGKQMKVSELVADHKRVCDELDSLKAEKGDGEKKEAAEGEEKEQEKNDEDSAVADAADEGETKEKKSPAQLDEEKEAEVQEAKRKNALETAKKDEAAAKAKRLANANSVPVVVETIQLSQDKVALGKSRYGR